MTTPRHPRLRLTADEASRLAEAIFGPDAEFAGQAPMPERLGGFRITRLLARGGMGIVYLGERITDGHLAAIKILPPGLRGETAADRLRRESAVLRRLDHPCIARFLDSGVLDDGATPWFAMEYVSESRPIDEHADRTGLDAIARIRLFLRVCDAVGHGHQRGVVHRDLKPSNVVVDAAGEPKVIDFGVARCTDIDTAMTAEITLAGAVIGTLAYMSPEQCSGDPSLIDTRADVYALGVILYELLCGSPPISVPSHSLWAAVDAIRSTEPAPPPPRSIDRSLATILRTSLAKRPDDRYASVAAFASDLRRYLDGDPIAAAPLSPWVRLTRAAGRHPMRSAMALFTALTAFAVVSFGLTYRYLQRAVEVVTREGGRYLDVRDGLGFIHHTFDARRNGGVHLAEFIEGDAAGRRADMVLFSLLPDAPVPHAGELCAYEAGTWTEPKWRASVTPNDVPRRPGEHADDGENGRFAVELVLRADVFPEVAGDEIITLFRHSPGPYSVVRVYDLDGRLRFQRWHRGALFAMHWSFDHHLLFLAGWNNDGTWADREGGEASRRGARPLVLIAISPRFDDTSPRLLSSEDDDDPTRAWYRTLLPSAFADAMDGGKHFFLAPRRRDSQGVVRFEMHPDGGGAGVSFVLNADGDEVLAERVVSDAYRAMPTNPILDPNRSVWSPLPRRRQQSP